MSDDERVRLVLDDISAELPTYDDTVLIAMVDGDAQLAAEVLCEFGAALRSGAGEIATTFAGGLTEELTVTAHRLKSSSRTVGAMRLGELCERLEVEATDGSLDHLGRLIAAVTAEIDAVAARLSAHEG
jgi:HPt (histidine-containing phosphotransfer) domain-containing protein